MLSYGTKCQFILCVRIIVKYQDLANGILLTEMAFGRCPGVDCTFSRGKPINPLPDIQK